MPSKRLTVGVVGVGAVGTVMGACLAEAGARIIAVDVPQRIAQIKKHGLRVVWEKRRLHQRVDTAESITALGAEHPDCLLLATKAYVLPKIMAEVGRVVAGNCAAISAENGIDTEAELARHIPQEHVSRMVINFAAGLDEIGAANVVWFNPPNSFGSLGRKVCPECKRVVDLLNVAGLTSEMVDAETIKKKAFLKTILTAALMPLCAVMGLTMREAMTGIATRQLAGDVVREGLAVAHGLGYDYGADIWKRCMGYLDKGGNHHPSMSVDLKAKRPTEIEFINGKILELGSDMENVPLEVNRVLVSMLMTQEVRNGTRKPEEFPDYIRRLKAADRSRSLLSEKW